jgi:hypothetical protein
MDLNLTGNIGFCKRFFSGTDHAHNTDYVLTPTANSAILSARKKYGKELKNKIQTSREPIRKNEIQSLRAKRPAAASRLTGPVAQLRRRR